MLLFIDNYCSFTYNIVQYLQQLNADVLTKRNDEISIEQIKSLKPSHIVVGPGPKDPRYAGVSVPLIQDLRASVPILGICLGHQSIAYAFGGKIIQAKKMMHGKTSTITHNNNSVFNNIPQHIKVMRYHSLVVDRCNHHSDLEITAVSDDGEIMGMRHKTFEIHGVQFHPESIGSEYGYEILSNFLDM